MQSAQRLGGRLDGLPAAVTAEADHEFLPHMWPRTSVAYTGTHDNDTVRGWWNQAQPRERAFVGSYLACSEHDIHWAMIRACANSVANMAVYPLQDVLGLGSEHRMNVPGVLGGNWGWRFQWDWIGAEPTRVLFGFWRGKRLLHIEPRLHGTGKYEMKTLEMHADTPLTLVVARRLVQEAHALNHSVGDPTRRTG